MKQAKRPTWKDALTTATIQDHTHLSSPEVIRIRTVKVCELNIVDIEIAELTGRLADQKLRRSKLDAIIDGLNAVIEKR